MVVVALVVVVAIVVVDAVVFVRAAAVVSGKGQGWCLGQQSECVNVDCDAIRHTHTRAGWCSVGLRQTLALTLTCNLTLSPGLILMENH